MSTSKPPEPGSCRRCSRIVLAGTAGGYPAVVDLTPLDVTGYREALIAGRRVYSVVEAVSGRPAALHDHQTAWDTGRTLLAAHGCPNPSVTPLAAVAPPTPTPVPAPPGSEPAGSPQPTAPGAGTKQSPAATTATPLRSKTCGYIVAGKPCGTDGRLYGFGGIRCTSHLPSTTRKANSAAA